jgi:hypothetical protein
MAKPENPSWSARLTLHWMAQAGIEEDETLVQIHRAICEGKLRAIGRKCNWSDGVGVPYGDMETIPPQEVSDLSPILSPRQILHLYPLYDEDQTTDFPNTTSKIENQEPQIYLGWSSLFFDASDIRRLWPSKGMQGAPGSKIDPKRRRIAPQIAAIGHNKIKMVHAVAQRLFGEQETRPENAVMAAELAKPEHNLGYAVGTIRQILNGTYGPAKQLGIGPFEQKKSNRPNRR